MQREMRRPSSALVAEHARRPRVDLHRVEVGDAALARARRRIGVFLRREDRVHRLGHEQRGPHALDLAPLDAPRRCVTDTTTSMSCNPVPGTTWMRTSRSTGSPSLPTCEVVLVGLVQDDVREERAVGNAARWPARSRPHVRSPRRSACRADAGHPCAPPSVSARVDDAHDLCVPAFRQAGELSARRDPASHHRLRRGRVGHLALVRQQRVDLAVDRVGDVDVVRRIGRGRGRATPRRPCAARDPRRSSSVCAQRLRASG